MKVTELKALLDELIAQGNGDLELLMSADAEGNDFNDVDEISVSYCYENEPIHPDDIGTEFEESELTKRVVIW